MKKEIALQENLLASMVDVFRDAIVEEEDFYRATCAAMMVVKGIDKAENLEICATICEEHSFPVNEFYAGVDEMHSKVQREKQYREVMQMVDEAFKK